MKKRLHFLAVLLVFAATILALASCQKKGGTRPTTTEAPTFEVVFVAGDGEILKTETVKLGQSATAPEVPNRPGYVFIGWDTDFSSVDCPITVTAQYQRVWTVQFVDAAGNEVHTYSVLDGEACPTPPINPYKENHVFVEWDQDYSSVKSDMIIHPVFREIGKCTVTFLGFNGEVLKTQQVYKGSNATAPNAPAVDHHTFKGWDKSYSNVTADLTVNALYEENAKYTVSFYDHLGNLLKAEELYAGENATAPSLSLDAHFTFVKWDKAFVNVQADLTVTAVVEEDAKFTVIFLDKDGSLLSEQEVYVGEDAVAPTPTVYEGYSFIAWDKAFVNVQADLTVSAVYKDNNLFVVIFKDADGNVLKTEEVRRGEGAVAPDAPVVDNHTFAGWDKAFDQVEEDLVVNATYTENPKYTVSFVDHDGRVLHTETVYMGKSASAPADPSRENFDFVGWDKAFDNVQDNLTVTATYHEHEKFTVTFVDHDGEVLKTQVVYIGKDATAPSTPQYDDLLFLGWDKAFDNVESDLTVTAQYVQCYTVTFKGYDGSIIKTEKVSQGESASAPAAPIREGYIFIGWDEAFDSVTSHLEITARYEIVKYNVSFSVPGGEAPATQVVEHGEKASRPADPVREGFDFVEWRVNGVKYDFSAPVVGDMTVVAVFKSNGQVPAATNTTLRIDPDRLEVWVDITLQLNVMPYNATKNFMANSGATFEFISTDPEILSIEDDGTFTAHALGSVKVFAVVTRGGSYTGSETYTATEGDILPAIIIDVVETPDYYKNAQEHDDQKITLGSTNTPRINKNDFLSFPSSEYGSANIALWYNGAEGVFTMTADDNPNVVSEWQKWLVAYEASGIPTTFITPSEDAYTNEGTAWQIITSNTPHAVQSHGATHLPINAEHSTARIWHEFYFGRQHIEAASGMDALIIGYANGTNYAPISSLFFIGGRGTVCVPNSVEKINYNQIGSYSGWGKDAEYFVDVLFGANASNGWISVHYHSINQGMDVILSNYAVLTPYVQSGQLWAPQFAQASQYGQERDTATLTVLESGADMIRLVVTDEMNDILFYHPLSVRVKVDNSWKHARAYQNGEEVNVQIISRDGETYLMVDAIPDQGEVSVVRMDYASVSVTEDAIAFTPVDTLGVKQTMTRTFAVSSEAWSYAYATQGGVQIPAAVKDGTLYVTYTVNGGEVKVVPLTNQYDSLDAYTMTMIANGAVAPDPDKPITVSSAEELVMLSQYVFHGNTLEGITIDLIADIDMTGVELAPIGRFFVYKKSSSTKMYLPFKGIFNGNSHTIYNLNMHRNEGTGGIFGYIENAVISDLHVKGNISAIDYVGGIAGNAIASTISRCSFEGTVEARVIHKERTNGRYVGGIVGNMSNLTLVEHCSVNGKVQTIGSLHSAATHAYIGGLAGSMAAGTINNSSFVGTVEAIYFVAGSNSQYVGGIVGNITGTGSAGLRIVSNCFAKCTVTGDEYVGGISGNMYSNSSTATIKVYNCAVQGTVNGQERVGGLSGHGQGISGTVIDNCFADVKVNAPATATYVGTILGSFQAEGYGLKVNTNFFVESNNPGMPVAVKFSGSGTFSSTAVENGAAALDALNAKAASSAYYSWELKDGTPSPTKDHIYRVLFLGKDGETLLSVSLPSGSTIEAPTAPDFLGFNFIGWDKAFSTAEADIVITALYQQVNVYTVTFVGKDGEILKTEQLEEGTSATAPSAPSYSGFEFIGWDNSFDNVTADITVTATYKTVSIYTVTFIGKSGETLKEEQINEGLAATAPTVIDYEGYRFDGWDVAFDNVTANLTVKAQYIKIWTVTYLDNAGQVWKVEVYDEGTVPTLPTTAPSVSGHTFKEWNPASLPAIYEDVVLSPVYQARPATSAVDYKVMHWSIGDNAQYGFNKTNFNAAVAEVDPDILIINGMNVGTYNNTKLYDLEGYTMWTYGDTTAGELKLLSVGNPVAVFYKTDKFSPAGDVISDVYINRYAVGEYCYVVFPLINNEGVVIPVVHAYLGYQHTEAIRTELMSKIKEALGTAIDAAIIRIYVASSTDTGAIHNAQFTTEADENGFRFVSGEGIATRRTDSTVTSPQYYYTYMVTYGKDVPAVSVDAQSILASTIEGSSFVANGGQNLRFYTKAVYCTVSIGATESAE